MFDIIHALTGAPNVPPSLDAMIEAFVVSQRTELDNLIWFGQSHEEPGARVLCDTYGELPDAARVHFLLSPIVYKIIWKSDPISERLGELAALGRAELRMAGGFGGAPADGDTWAPMGDAVLRYRDEECVLERVEKLGGLIAMDFDSPYARNVDLTSALMYAQPADFTENERLIAQDKLRSAFEYIENVSPTHARVIRNYTRAIRLRKRENFFGRNAEHVTDTIGEMRLLNPQIDDWTVQAIAESLIHESTHNLLSTYEHLKGPFELTPSINKSYRPVSPWTGNPIPVPSFCHAVLVWFTLFHFSLLELARPALEEERRNEILKRRNTYAAGFLIPTPLSDCIRGLSVLSEAIFSAIDHTQRNVQSIVRDLCEKGSSKSEPIEAVPA